MTDRDFPQALVDERAKELYAACYPAGAWKSCLAQDAWHDIARLSLRREYEACEPLLSMLRDIARAACPSDNGICSCYRCRARRVMRSWDARYTPEPPKPTLAEAVQAYIERSTDDRAFQAMREALARERAK